MPDSLSHREAHIVRLIAAGFTRAAIADLTGLGENTVRRDIRTMCERYGVRMELLPDAAGLDWDDDDVDNCPLCGTSLQETTRP